MWVRKMPGKALPSSPGTLYADTIVHMFDHLAVPMHEVAPTRCPNGHPWGPNRVLVGWLPCSCTEVGRGHRTYHCRTCDAVIYRPEHRT